MTDESTSTSESSTKSDHKQTRVNDRRSAAGAKKQKKQKKGGWKRDATTPTDPTLPAEGAPPPLEESADGTATFREEIDSPRQLLDHKIVDFANILMKGLSVTGAQTNPLDQAFSELVAAYCELYPDSAIAAGVRAAQAAEAQSQNN